MNNTLKEKDIISADLIDESDMFEWMAEIKGSEATAYESGIFQIKIKFPKENPFKRPLIRFLTKIFHANIHIDGEICCESLKNMWSPASPIIEILTEIINLLKSPNYNTCHLYGYPIDLVDRCYKNRDYDNYKQIANEWTVKYTNCVYNDFYNNSGNIIEYK